MGFLLNFQLIMGSQLLLSPSVSSSGKEDHTVTHGEIKMQCISLGYLGIFPNFSVFFFFFFFPFRSDL